MAEQKLIQTNQEALRLRIVSELRLQIEDMKPLNIADLGDNSEVYTGIHGGEKIIIKLLKSGSGFEMEHAALDLFFKHDIPAPKVLGLLPSAKYDKPIIIETAAAGMPISRMPENIAIYGEAGKILKRIHDIKVSGFGSFEITNDGLQGKLSSWKKNVEEFKIDFGSLERKGFIDKKERLKLEAAHEVSANIPLRQASFMHSDFSPQHVFSDGVSITGIIDLSTCYAGDPHKDITNMQYFLNQEQLSAFNNGYGPLSTDELIPTYALLAAANKVAYRADKGFIDRLPSALKILKQRLKEIN